MGLGLKQRGLTLLELAVVLLILAALAGLTLPYVMGTGEKAMCQVTDATMQAVKEALVGGKVGGGFYGDTLGYLPKATKSTTGDYDLTYLYTAPTDSSWGTMTSYNAKTGVGWHGPYLQGGNVAPLALAASFSATSGVSATVHRAVVGSQALDGWGRPVVLQVPSVASCDQLTGLTGSKAGYCARLISAGPGNGPRPDDAVLDTPINDDATTTAVVEAARQGDDRLLYLHIPPPAQDRANDDCQ